MKFVVAAALAVFGLVVLPNGATAQSTDEILRRLDVLEKKNDALEKENTALRDRMRRLEGSKHYSASAPPPATSSAPLAALAKADPRTEAGPTAFTWTGFYVGAHGGYTSGNFLPPTQTTGLASNIGLSGGFGGVQAGYNYQFAPHWLFGLEQDISIGNVSGAQSQPFPNPTINVETNYSGTIRERFGYVWDRALFYETAGIAWGVNKVDLQFQNATQLALAGGSGNSLNVSETHWQFGVALGAGMEWAIDPSLSVKVEYLYTYLTKEQYFSGSNFSGPVGWPLSTVRAGVNWRFN